MRGRKKKNEWSLSQGSNYSLLDMIIWQPRPTYPSLRLAPLFHATSLSQSLHVACVCVCVCVLGRVTHTQTTAERDCRVAGPTPLFSRMFCSSQEWECGATSPVCHRAGPGMLSRLYLVCARGGVHGSRSKYLCQQGLFFVARGSQTRTRPGYCWTLRWCMCTSS